MENLKPQSKSNALEIWEIDSILLSTTPTKLFYCIFKFE